MQIMHHFTKRHLSLHGFWYSQEVLGPSPSGTTVTIRNLWILQVKCIAERPGLWSDGNWSLNPSLHALLSNLVQTHPAHNHPTGICFPCLKQRVRSASHLIHVSIQMSLRDTNPDNPHSNRHSLTPNQSLILLTHIPTDFILYIDLCVCLSIPLQQNINSQGTEITYLTH